LEKLTYRFLEEKDIPQCKALWYIYPGQPLGAWYNIKFEMWLNKHEMVVCVDEQDHVVAFAVYHVGPRKKNIEVQHILVSPELRGNGISKRLIYKIYLLTEEARKQGFPMVVSCVEGLDNNTYYDRFGTVYDRKKFKKEGREWMRFYELNQDIISTWGPDPFLD
jgi:predicted GNAT family acetyltransferase